MTNLLMLLALGVIFGAWMAGLRRVLLGTFVRVENAIEALDHPSGDR